MFDPPSGTLNVFKIKLSVEPPPFSNTCPDPLENLKATKPAFNVGLLIGPASGMPLKWRFDDDPLLLLSSS